MCFSPHAILPTNEKKRSQRKLFGFKIVIKEAKRLRSTETVSRVNTLDNISSNVRKAKNKAHFIAG